MEDPISCEKCKHWYKFFKQVVDEKGLPDFITISRCRLDNEINPDGTPCNSNCFESRR